METDSEALRLGIKAHKTGKLTDADRYYRAVLEKQPNHPDANHNMGVLLAGSGQTNLSLAYFKRALEANSKVTQFWLSILNALIALNRYADVERLIQQAKEVGVYGMDFVAIEKQIELMQSDNTFQKKFVEPPKQRLMKIINQYRGGFFDAALEASYELEREFSSTAELLNIKGAIYTSMQNYAEAIYAFEQAIQKKPHFVETYKNLGIVHNKIGNNSEAIKVLKQGLAIEPISSELSYNLGNFMRQSNDLLGAVQCYHDAIKIKPNYAEAYYNLGNTHQALHDYDQAILNYKSATDIKPDYAQAHNNLGNALRLSGDLAGAIDSYNNSIVSDPAYAEAFNNLGVSYQTLGDFPSAITNYELAIEKDPKFISAYSNMCEAYEKFNKLKELKEFLSYARQQLIELPADIKLYEVIYYYRSGEYTLAEEATKLLELGDFRGTKLTQFLEIQGKIADKLSKYDEAVSFYQQMNTSLKNHQSFDENAAREYILVRQQNLKELRNKTFVPQPHHGLDHRQTVFMIGFPRSGTTLLDSILRSHSKIEVSEEKHYLASVKKLIKEKGSFNYIDNFPSSGIRQQAILRYEEELREELLSAKAFDVHIDKLPLHILDLPMINFLFPNAKYIFAMRHPFDVILSNWMQNYALNPAMSNMLDIEKIVEFYVLAMETYTESKSKLDLNVHYVKYEDIIENMPKAVNKLLEFLDLEFEEAVMDYRQTALKRGKISTPSYSQVTQPLYSSSIYRWTEYNEFLMQHCAKIEPWIQDFGY